MTDKPHLCLTCKHANWVMTKHDPPRVNADRGARCHAPVDRGELLASMMAILPGSVLADAEIFASQKQYPDRRRWLAVDDPITECSRYERKAAP